MAKKKARGTKKGAGRSRKPAKKKGKKSQGPKVLESSTGWDGVSSIEWASMKADGDTLLCTVVGEPVRRLEHSQRFDNERTRVYFQVIVGDPAKAELVPMILATSRTSGGAIGRVLEGGKLAGKVLLKVTRHGKGLATTYDAKIVRSLSAADLRKVKDVKLIDLDSYLQRGAASEE